MAWWIILSSEFCWLVTLHHQWYMYPLGGWRRGGESKHTLLPILAVRQAALRRTSLYLLWWPQRAYEERVSEEHQSRPKPVLIRHEFCWTLRNRMERWRLVLQSGGWNRKLSDEGGCYFYCHIHMLTWLPNAHLNRFFIFFFFLTVAMISGLTV